MQREESISILSCGVGPQNIPLLAEKLVADADVLAGGKRLLAYFPEFSGETIVLGAGLDLTLQELVKKHEEGQNVIILASGDSQFYGITRTIKRYVPQENLTIIPNITAFQALFAKIATSGWERAQFYSVHGKADCALPWHILLANQLSVIYCDPKHPASSVAARLIQKCPESAGRQAVIGENIGQDREVITTASLAELAGMDSDGLSILVITAEEDPMSVTDRGLPLGMNDDVFEHQNNLITHSEIRSVVIAKLRLGKGVMWDLGAGSGSVGIEAALLCPDLTVYAVEKEPQRVSHINCNCHTLGAENVNVLQGNILEHLEQLPAPRSVFVGGGGDDICDIVTSAYEKLLKGGTLVVAAVTLETKAALNTMLKDAWCETLSISVARAKSVANKKILKPDNPVDLFIFKK